MSTKFRQSFLLLCEGCRPSSKGHRSNGTFSYKEYTLRQVMGVNRFAMGGTVSTTMKGSYHLAQGSQLHEKRSLLADNTPTPVTAAPMGEAKFTFPEVAVTQT